jgi:hypothetical protein
MARDGERFFASKSFRNFFFYVERESKTGERGDRLRSASNRMREINAQAGGEVDYGALSVPLPARRTHASGQRDRAESRVHAARGQVISAAA